MKDVISVDENTSDGFHTFKELYDHRIALFIALMKSHPELSWRANNHDDGTGIDNWFIAGMHLPTGDISYHLPATDWTKLDNVGIKTSNRSPKWDGHTPADVVSRLNSWSANMGLSRKLAMHSLLISKLPEKMVRSEVFEGESDGTIEAYNSAIDDMHRVIDEMFEVHNEK